MKNNTGYIIGAYPCAPSFHQKSEEEETEFWRQLSDTPDIRGWSSLVLNIFTRSATSGYCAIHRELANRGHRDNGNHASP